MKKLAILLTWCVCITTVPADADTSLAGLYGNRESIEDISLSPDGLHVAYIQPGAGKGSVLFIASLADGVPKPITHSDADPWKLRWCSWASNARLVCFLSGIIDNGDGLAAYTRLIAINSDGSNIKQLGQRASGALGIQQFDGNIIGWPADDKGEVLMSREYVGESETGSYLANKAAGLGVDLIDTQTLKTAHVESPRSSAVNYISDASGKVRLLESQDRDNEGRLKNVTRYFYRSTDSNEWKVFSVETGEAAVARPFAVDSARNIAYAFKKKDGRDAVYSVSLDGQLSETLLLASEKVDVSDLVRFGRSGRIIGAQLVTDKRETTLFDPEYKSLVAKLSKALPGLPLINMVDASRDESKIMLFAGSDKDPGRYYLYDKTSKKLAEIALARPELGGKPLSTVKLISYPADDGTMIPAYLTLPSGSDGKGLPAIVMPHGGPSSRDEWGFDWLSQYFAALGYAVLQPNFRGSAGYGDDWYVDNGFKSWRLAIGDVNSAGKWLISEGITKPDRLGILGWSYGGYAALQSDVLNPLLFKAVVAIAPVTDLKLLVDQQRRFTNYDLTAKFVGSGEHIVSGSPLQQANKIDAPVLLFSGDKDLNVAIGQSRAMAAALKKAGKNVEFVTYPGLDHQIDDSTARQDMLQKSADFLAKYLQTK